VAVIGVKPVQKGQCRLHIPEEFPQRIGKPYLLQELFIPVVIDHAAVEQTGGGVDNAVQVRSEQIVRRSSGGEAEASAVFRKVADSLRVGIDGVPHVEGAVHIGEDQISVKFSHKIPPIQINAIITSPLLLVNGTAGERGERHAPGAADSPGFSISVRKYR